MQTRMLFENDARFRTELTQTFPNSPEFVHYLCARILANHGSLVIVREMIFVLKQFFPKCEDERVLSSVVARLRVDHDERQFSSLLWRIRDTPHERELHRAKTLFALQLVCHILTECADNEEVIVITNHRSIDQMDHAAHVRTFICAYCMLAGITTNRFSEHV